ncbi:MAG TPA: hypothetical protein VMD91_04280 [Candidatus Sulfotelmatobacter sp.]|nr:hypothetical protein [Candidatus Sulfotelmatobacter sp.]
MRLVPAVIALGLLAIPLPGLAQGTAPAAVDGGTIEGRVTNVDYQRGLLHVETSRKVNFEVSVMPTTSIQTSDPGYHAITDVSRGSKVSILASRIGGKLVAQIIKLFKH